MPFGKATEGCEMHPDSYPPDSSPSRATLMLQECIWRLPNAGLLRHTQGKTSCAKRLLIGEEEKEEEKEKEAGEE